MNGLEDVLVKLEGHAGSFNTQHPAGHSISTRAFWQIGDHWSMHKLRKQSERNKQHRIMID
jgi:hypothetical protein